MSPGAPLASLSWRHSCHSPRIGISKKLVNLKHCDSQNPRKALISPSRPCGLLVKTGTPSLQHCVGHARLSVTRTPIPYQPRWRCALVHVVLTPVTIQPKQGQAHGLCTLWSASSSHRHNHTACEPGELTPA